MATILVVLNFLQVLALMIYFKIQIYFSKATRPISDDDLSVLLELNTVRNPEINLITLVEIALSWLTWIIRIQTKLQLQKT